MCWCWLAHHCETLTDSPNFWTTVSMTHVSFGLFHFPKGPSIYQLSKGLNWRLKQRVLFAHTEVPFLKPRGVAPCWMSEGLHRGVGRFHRDCKNFYYSQKRDQLFFFWPTSGPRSSTRYLKPHSLFDFLPHCLKSHGLFDFLLFFCIMQPKSRKALWKSSSSVQAIKAQPFRRSSVALMDFSSERWKALVVLLHLHSLTFSASVLYFFFLVRYISAVCTSAQTVEKPHKTEIFSSFKNQGLWRAFCLKPAILTRVNPSAVTQPCSRVTSHAFVSFVNWLCLCCFGAKKINIYTYICISHFIRDFFFCTFISLLIVTRQVWHRSTHAATDHSVVWHNLSLTLGMIVKKKKTTCSEVGE